jgi:hypothetical protein
MIQWPEILTQDLARRRAIVFLGSGVSKNSVGIGGKRPPLWKEFLEQGAVRCEKRRAREVIRHVKDGDLLTACELLKDALGPQWQELINSEFVTPQYTPSKIHELIFRLDARLVVTQNFDRIYDVHAAALSQGTIYVKSYDEHDTAEFIRRRRRVVLKAHGSIDAPNDMVFTKGDYARARHAHAGFYALLDGLILTHTCVFLGCGTSDPDIAMMLERAVHLHPSTVPHYIVMGGKLNDDLLRAYRRTLNLQVLAYDSKNNHAALLPALEDLVIKVEAERDQIAISRDW